MEVAGLALGAVSIAGLFSTCVECFDYFKAAKSMNEDVRILLVKLDVEKARLLIWGNGVGILKAANGERDAGLQQDSNIGLIRACLETIQSLLTNAEKLRVTYGVEESTDEVATPMITDITGIVSSNSMNVFKASYKRFSVRLGGSTEKRKRLATVTKWAIHEKSQFEELIVHLRELVNGLHNILPIKRGTEDEIIRSDIASITGGVSRLRLVQEACEDSYQPWSDMASEIIVQSELGTIDRRNIEEWIEDENGLDVRLTAQSKSNVYSTSYDIDFPPYIPLFTVFTGECTKTQPTPYCNATNFPDRLFQEKTLNYAAGLGNNSIGTCLLGNFGYKEICTNYYSKSQEYSIGLSNSLMPLARIFIHCAPCARLIHTAFAICAQISDYDKLSVEVRPDERLSTGCCSHNTGEGLQRLMSIVDEINYEESTALDLNRIIPKEVGYIDRPWLEQHIFNIEEQEDPYRRILVNSIFSILREYENSKWGSGDGGAVMILAEATSCGQLIQSKPFPHTGRLPRLNEIYELRLEPKLRKEDEEEANYIWKRKFLQTFTPRFLDRPQRKRPMRVDSIKADSVSDGPQLKKVTSSSTWSVSNNSGGGSGW